MAKVLKFEKKPLLETRYENIRPSFSPIQKDDEHMDYPDYLKAGTRTCCRDGFLDSRLFQKRYLATYKRQEQLKNPASPRRSESEPHASPTSAQPENTSSPASPRRTHEIPSHKEEPTSISAPLGGHATKLPEQRDRYLRDFHHRLKAIELEKWKAKNQESVLKRYEIDISKDKRKLRAILRQEQEEIARRQEAADAKSAASNEKYREFWSDFASNSADAYRERLQAARVKSHARTTVDMTSQLELAKLENRYRLKFEALHAKRAESERLSRDFERRLLSKEEEQLKIQRDLFDITIQIYMEGKKRRDNSDLAKAEAKKRDERRLRETVALEDQLESQMGANNVEERKLMEQRRIFSAQKAQAESEFAFKTSEANGQMQNARTRLEENRVQQGKLERHEIDERIEARVREIEARIKESSDRRLATLEANLEDTRKRTEEADGQARLKYNERFFDEKRQQYADQLKHLDREMREVRQKELEQEKRVKGAQLTRVKRANEREALEREVASKRRDFTHKYVRELIGSQRLELQLSQELAHASTALEEATTQRNEGERELRVLRGRGAEDEVRHARVMQQSQHLESIAHRAGTPIEAHFALTQPKPLPGATLASA